MTAKLMQMIQSVIDDILLVQISLFGVSTIIRLFPVLINVEILRRPSTLTRLTAPEDRCSYKITIYL
jgi:hypothetical protein